MIMQATPDIVTTVPAIIPAGSLQVVAKPNPFKARLDPVVVPACGNINDILLASGIEFHPAAHIVVQLGDCYIPRENWGRVYPKPNQQLVVTSVPMGGGDGKDVFSVFITIAAIVAISAVPGAIGVPLFGGEVGIGTIAIRVGIGIVAALAQSALIRAPSLGASTGSQPTPGILGTRNRLAKYEPTPNIYGERRYTPPFASSPFTVLEGNDQFSVSTFNIGYGPHILSEFRLGDTLIDGNYEDVELVVFETGKTLESETLVSLRFDGVNDKVTIADNSALSLAGNFTIEAKVRVEDSSFSTKSRVTVLRKGNIVGQLNYDISVDEDGRLRIRIITTRIDGREALLIGQTEARSIRRNHDHHIAVSVNIASNPRRESLVMKIYINGRIQKIIISERRQKGVTGIITNNNDLIFGEGLVESGSPTGNFGGLLKDVRIWNIIRTEDEIRANHQKQLAGTEAGLVGYWRMEEGTGTTLADSSPNSNTGTIFEEDWVSIERSDIKPFLASVDEQNPNLSIKKSIGPLQRTTRVDTDQISIDITLPQGYFRQSGRNQVAPDDPLNIEVSYRRVGDPTFVIVHTFTFDAVITRQIRENFTWDVERGQFEVRLERTTDDRIQEDFQTHFDLVQWSAFRSIRRDSDFVRIDGLTIVALKIKATDQLNGAVENFNCVASRVLNIFNGTDWNDEQLTSSPAWACADILSGTVNRTPISRDDLDGQAFLDWAEDSEEWFELTDVPVGQSITINDLIFKSHPTTTTIENRDFSIAGDDAADAVEIASIINDDASGVPGVRAKLNGKRVILEATEPNTDIIVSASNLAFRVSPAKNFNGVLDFPSNPLEMFEEIALVGRASRTVVDDKHTIVRDILRTTSIQHISPRNSWGYKGSKSLSELPDALKIRYADRGKGYAVDEIIVYDDGFSADGLLEIDPFGVERNTVAASTFDFLDASFGVTDRDQAWRMGRHYLRVNRLRRETHEVFLDFQYLVLQRGDLLKFTHDVILVGLGSALIKSVTLDGGSNVTAITVDDLFEMEAGKVYGVVIQLSTGVSICKQIVTVAGEQSTVTFVIPIPAASTAPRKDDYVNFGINGKEFAEMIVKAIIPGTDLIARIVMVDAAPGIHVDELETVPDLGSQITLPANPEVVRPDKPIIIEVQSNEDVIRREQDGGLTSRIRITLNEPTGIRNQIKFYEFTFRKTSDPDGWSPRETAPASGREIFVSPVVDGELYNIRVRSVDGTGLNSDWTELNQHKVIGKSTPPPDVEELNYAVNLASWPYPQFPIDFAGHVLRWHPGENNDWDSANPLHEGLLSNNSFQVPEFPPGQFTLMVKAEDTTGNQSVNVANVVFTVALFDRRQILLEVDHKDIDYPGPLLFGTRDKPLKRIRANPRKVYYGPDDEAYYDADDSAIYYSQKYLEMNYRINIKPLDFPEITPPYFVSIVPDIVARSYNIQFRQRLPRFYWQERGKGNDNNLYEQRADDELYYEPEYTQWPGTFEVTSLTVNVDLSVFIDRWIPNETHRNFDYTKPIIPNTPTAFIFQALIGGVTGATEPTWPTVVDGTVVDGTITWIARPAINVEDNSYQIQITTAGGEIQGIINSLKVQFHTPLIEEWVGDLDINDVGGVRVPITQPFQVIQAVDITFDGDTGLEVTARVVSKEIDGNEGPLIKVFSNGVAINTQTVDVGLKGY